MSSVQGSLSSQLRAGPGVQMPLVHRSFVVHASPSSHDLPLFVWTQPMVWLQLSSVQTLLSLQSSAPLPMHLPFTHWSTVVQGSLSLQVAPLSGCGLAH